MNTENSLQGKTALITGAGSGIGRAAALYLNRAGVQVVALSRTESELLTLQNEAKNPNIIPLVADVGSQQKFKEAMLSLEGKISSLDYVFANAGINGVWAPIETLDEKEWDETLRINLTGTFLTVKYALPHIKGKGSIVVNASVNGTRMFSNTGASAYASSKGAQVSFAKMMALELAKRQIRVNVICPGWIETNIDKNTQKRGLEGIRPPIVYPEGSVPLKNGGPGSADEVAQLVWYLFSDLSSHVTGTEIFIDGGESLMEG
jgi:NAD(P)-dependent dehydrogenase (short-subunit alcohol dehydrogenase family)